MKFSKKIIALLVLTVILTPQITKAEYGDLVYEFPHLSTAHSSEDFRMTFDCDLIDAQIGAVELYANTLDEPSNDVTLYWDTTEIMEQTISNSSGEWILFDFSDETFLDCTNGQGEVVMRFASPWIAGSTNGRWQVRRDSGNDPAEIPLVQTYNDGVLAFNNTTNGYGVRLYEYVEPPASVPTPPAYSMNQLSTTTCTGTATSSVCTYEYSTTTDNVAVAIDDLNETLVSTALIALWFGFFLFVFGIIRVFTKVRYGHY